MIRSRVLLDLKGSYIDLCTNLKKDLKLHVSMCVVANIKFSNKRERERIVNKTLFFIKVFFLNGVRS